MVLPLISLLLAARPKFALWVADPAWSKGAERIPSEMQIGGLTEGGEVFTPEPPGVWSQGRFTSMRRTFFEVGCKDTRFASLLPDGSILSGGLRIIDGENLSADFEIGYVIRGGKLTPFDEPAYATAVSPNGKHLAGKVVDARETSFRGFKTYLACRMNNGRALILPGPERERFTPVFVSDKGVILGEGPFGSIVWREDSSYWTTPEKITKEGKTFFFFNAVSSDNTFVGHSTRFDNVSSEFPFPVRTAFVSDGKTFKDLKTSASARGSDATGFYDRGYLGEFNDRRDPLNTSRGCIWLQGQFFRLQDCLEEKSEWTISTPMKVNKRGQIAAYVWRVVKSRDGDKIINSFGVLTPVK